MSALTQARAAGRVGCCVPFCGRTRKSPAGRFSEWICGDHWRLIDKERRRVWGRVHRRWRRFGPASRETAPLVAYARLWAALKRQAIERAAGITG